MSPNSRMLFYDQKTNEWKMIAGCV